MDNIGSSRGGAALRSKSEAACGRIGMELWGAKISIDPKPTRGTRRPTIDEKGTAFRACVVALKELGYDAGNLVTLIAVKFWEGAGEDTQFNVSFKVVVANPICGSPADGKELSTDFGYLSAADVPGDEMGRGLAQAIREQIRNYITSTQKALERMMTEECFRLGKLQELFSDPSGETK